VKLAWYRDTKQVSRLVSVVKGNLFRHRMKYEQSEQIAFILRWVFKDIGRSASASFSLHHRDGLLVCVFRRATGNQLPMSEPLK